MGETFAIPDDFSSASTMTGRVIGTQETQVLVYETVTQRPNLVEWCSNQHQLINRALQTYGAVLVRGLVDDVDTFEAAACQIGGDLLEYTERSTPRTTVQGKVYTSTEYPADQTIPQHNENSYAHSWPRLLFMCCLQPSSVGGETPLADSRSVLRLIPDSVVERFRKNGVLYSRTYRDTIGLTWQEAFGTDDKIVVEAYCRRHGVEFDWTNDGFRTRHRQAATTHEPATGEEVWFNQAHLFHVSNMPPEIREALIALYQEEGLPRHAYLGNGQAISSDDLSAIRSSYERATFAFPWSKGDFLMLNNLLVSHGRRPYKGERRVLVAMSGALGTQ